MRHLPAIRDAVSPLTVGRYGECLGGPDDLAWRGRGSSEEFGRESAADVEGGHQDNESCSQRVGMYQTERRPLADRSHPAVRGAPIEALAVMAQQDGAVSPFPDREGRVGVVEPFGGEEEPSDLSSVHAAPLARVHGGSAHVLGRVGRDPPVDMREALEPAGRGQSAVDCRSGQARFLHRRPVHLEVGLSCLEYRQAVIGGPLEEVAEIVTVGTSIGAVLLWVVMIFLLVWGLQPREHLHELLCLV